jgi:hypothetical protein
MIDPEDLAGPPSGDNAKGWVYGVVFAGILGAYGLFGVFTGHAVVPNITLRGVPQVQPGLLRDIQGADAVLTGITIFFVAAFAHFHWFWGNHRWLRIGESITVVIRKGTVPFSSNENRDSPPLIHSPMLSRYYEIGKVAALVGILLSVAGLLYRAFR